MIRTHSVLQSELASLASMQFHLDHVLVQLFELQTFLAPEDLPTFDQVQVHIRCMTNAADAATCRQSLLELGICKARLFDTEDLVLAPRSGEPATPTAGKCAQWHTRTELSFNRSHCCAIHPVMLEAFELDALASCHSHVGDCSHGDPSVVLFAENFTDVAAKATILISR